MSKVRVLANANGEVADLRAWFHTLIEELPPFVPKAALVVMYGMDNEGNVSVVPRWVGVAGRGLTAPELVYGAELLATVVKERLF